MKANAPKRKVFQDALDLLAEDPVKDTPVPVNGIVSIPVEEIHPFHDHPFRLYEGERLEDMVQSIKDHGVLNPVIVRREQSILAFFVIPCHLAIRHHRERGHRTPLSQTNARHAASGTALRTHILRFERQQRGIGGHKHQPPYFRRSFRSGDFLV